MSDSRTSCSSKHTSMISIVAFTAFYAAFFFFCILSFAASRRIFASSAFSMAAFKYVRKVRFFSSRIFTATLFFLSLFSMLSNMFDSIFRTSALLTSSRQAFPHIKLFPPWFIFFHLHSPSAIFGIAVFFCYITDTLRGILFGVTIRNGQLIPNKIGINP